MSNRLQYISAEFEGKGHVSVIEEALEAGCKWIQLRIKNESDDRIAKIINEVKPLCSKYGAKLILNDYPHLVKRFELDGVHLGKNDMCPIKARQLLGDQFIIGATANTIDDIVKHSEKPVNYIGLGPFRFTSTKKGLDPILGIEGYTSILDKMRKHNIDLPVYAIGGIEVEDLPGLMKTGIFGVAVSGIINKAENKKELIDSMMLSLS